MQGVLAVVIAAAVIASLFGVHWLDAMITGWSIKPVWMAHNPLRVATWRSWVLVYVLLCLGLIAVLFIDGIFAVWLALGQPKPGKLTSG